jgi:cell division protein FtsI (penicillin-binding protein 3)
VLFLAAAYGLLGARLHHVQVGQHERQTAVAESILQREDETLARRGDLRDRSGILLARDLAACEVGMDPSHLSRTEIEVFLRVAAESLELPAERRQECMRRALEGASGGRRFVPLSREVEPQLAAALRRRLEEVLPPTRVEKSWSSRRGTMRSYPRGSFLAQVLGTVDADGSGVEGVERVRDLFLAPRSGCRRVQVDASGELRYYFPHFLEVPPVNGLDLYLTIDSRTQRILEEELAAGIERHRAEAALGVVMDCRNGDVLAMASLPAYDPNHFRRYPREELQRRRKNRAVESVYEPGSVFKPFVVATAIEKGLCSPDELLWQGGSSTSIAGRPIRDVSDHGPITVEKAIVHSSNIGMSVLGLRLGKSGLLEVFERFGFCRRTGVGLPFEARGRHTSPREWRETWTSLSVSFGYEVMVTPIQLCSAFAALVNGGILLQPRVLARMEGNGQRRAIEPAVRGRAVSEETSRLLRDMLVGVVREGTGRGLQLDGFEFGGKSGTADMGPLYTKTNYLSSFEAFAPYESPQVVVLVMVEKPRGGKYYGSLVAGPVVASVIRRMFCVPAPEKLSLVQ